MRVATLSRTTLPKPWTVLALATLTLIMAGATSLDTDRSELIDENQKFYVGGAVVLVVVFISLFVILRRRSK